MNTPAKDTALLRLWSQTLSSLEFNHPDSRVHVIPRIQFGNGDCTNFVNVNLQMYMLRSTEYPEFTYGDFNRNRPFVMYLNVNMWPGYRAAELALVGTWLIYLRHETMELVKYRDHNRNRPEWHPHTGFEISSDVRVATARGQVDPVGEMGIAYIMSAVCGLNCAEDILRNDQFKARKELETEIGFVTGTVGDW